MLLIIFGINMFFESMLERSAGIFALNLFFCFFVVKNNIFATACEKQTQILENP